MKYEEISFERNGQYLWNVEYICNRTLSGGEWQAF